MPQADMKNLYTTKGSSEGSDNIRPFTLLDPLKQNFMLLLPPDKMPFTVVPIFSYVRLVCGLRILLQRWYLNPIPLHSSVKPGLVIVDWTGNDR